MRSAKAVTDQTAKPSRLPSLKARPTNGDTAFDPKGFLARTGLGKKILLVKKDQVAYAQGDPADTIFYVQKGQLGVTVTSTAEGKEATITLVGDGEFLGEAVWSGLTLFDWQRLQAMTDCALLSISKTEMVRALRQDPAFSNVFVSFLLVRNAQNAAVLVDQLFNSSEKSRIR